MHQLWAIFRTKNRIGWPDIIVAVFIVGLLYAVLDLGRGMVLPLPSQGTTTIHLSPRYLPYYAGRSLLRMFIAYFFAIIFSLIYGRVAAYHRLAGRIMVPALDLLQSIPVYGFLTITITAFLRLFPGNQFGVECASIFAIFTAQAWNITFSFYHSLTTMPADLKEAADINRLRPWARFIKLEVPYSMIGLVYNSMMSFGGSWFFLIASESITVLNKTFVLPGIGSYLGEALNRGNTAAILYGLLTMAIVVVAVDQLLWRPAVAWSHKFKMDQNESADPPTSWFLQILRRSEWIQKVLTSVFGPVIRAGEKTLWQLETRPLKHTTRTTGPPFARVLRWLILIVIMGYFSKYAISAIGVVSSLGLLQMLTVVKFGFYTFLRVIASTLLGALWAVPVGVAIGFNSRLSRIMQPIVQIAASFPSNALYPLILLIYLALHISFNIGAVPLMMLGTQWYILFNVIAGTMAIPSGLKEASSILRLRSMSWWKTLILPAIFPALITGGVTASGGAWNASVLAELITYHGKSFIASGLGAYITQAANTGNWARLTWGLVVMSVFVVLFNRLVWRPLYRLAETKYHLD